jgi:hypothetical protein
MTGEGDHAKLIDLASRALHEPAAGQALVRGGG